MSSNVAVGTGSEGGLLMLRFMCDRGDGSIAGGLEVVERWVNGFRESRLIRSGRLKKGRPLQAGPQSKWDNSDDVILLTAVGV